MALDEGISKLIGRIYKSAENSAEWEQLILDVIALTNTRCAVQTVSDLSHCDMVRTTTFGSPLRHDGVSEYQSENLFAIDPSFCWAMRHPLARFCDTAEIESTHTQHHSEFVEWNRNQWTGSNHWLVGYTSPGDELTFGLSVHPAAEDGPVSPEGKSIFKMLFEHMDSAIRLATRPPLFSSERDVLMLIDRLGAVRHISPAAERLLSEGDGLSVEGSCLQAADSASTRRLNQAILSALSALRTGEAGGAVSLPRPSGKRDLLVTINPLLFPPSPFDAFRPAALLRVVDPGSGLPPSAADRWSALFGLTPAEGRFAEALLGGDQNLRHTAECLGITYATARVHLRQLFDKTSTHSQAQLARLLTKVE
jgi:DNA-binding CsgD family transcriptional regulator